MKIFRVVFYLSFILLIPFFSDAQEPEVKITPLVTVEGRVISKKDRIILITAEKKGYILKEIKGLEDVFKKIQDVADKDVDVTLSTIDTGETKGYIFIDRDSSIQKEPKPRARKTEYRVLLAAYIHKIQEGSKISNTDISQPVTPETPSSYGTLDSFQLKQINGKVSKCNFKSALPSIELDGKSELVFLLPGEAQAIKMLEGNLMTFKPKDVIEEGIKVGILYLEKDNLKNAQVIIIRENK